jgi:hypothetical protein
MPKNRNTVSQIVPFPAIKPETIRIDVVSPQHSSVEHCYICFESDALEKSPCTCQALCHIDPCLLHSIDINQSSECTICRTQFWHKLLLDRVKQAKDNSSEPVESLSPVLLVEPCNCLQKICLLLCSAFLALLAYCLIILWFDTGTVRGK